MLFNTLIKLVLLTQITTFLGVSDLPPTKGADVQPGQVAGDVVVVEKPTRLINQSLGLDITAKSALAVDNTTGKVLFEKNPDEVRPVASITKLATALVFLDHQPPLDKEMIILRREEVEGGRLYLRSGEKVTVKNLFYTSLVGSANNATLALARSTNLRQEKFVALMNLKMKALGLPSTHFEEPTGLSEKNVSTAREVVKLLNHAMQHELIRQALATPTYQFKSLSGITHNIKNTNKLLNSYLGVQGGKTGFTDEAGNCLVVQIKGADGQEIIVTVLGSASAHQRFQEAKGIAWWVFENWTW